MPAGFIPNEGIAQTLLELLGTVPVSVLPWQLIYWINDITPDHTVVLADLVEASWGGYVQLTLDRAEWLAPTVEDGCAHSTWGINPTIWTVTSGPLQTNYGYAYVDLGAGVLRFVQRFDPEDLVPVEIGATVSLLPTYTLTSAECS